MPCADREDDPSVWTLRPVEPERWHLLWPLASLCGEAGPCRAWLDGLAGWVRAAEGRRVAALSCCGGPALAGLLLEWPRVVARRGRLLHVAHCWVAEPGRPGAVARALLATLERRALALGADGLLVAPDAGLGTGPLRAAGYTPVEEGWFRSLAGPGGSACASHRRSS